MRPRLLASACLSLIVVVGASCSDDQPAVQDGSTGTSGVTIALEGTTTDSDHGTTTVMLAAPTLLAPVAFGQPAELGEGIVVAVTAVVPVQLEARGPGDIAGPGVAVTVEVRNDGTLPVNLADVVVTARYGDTPASPNLTEPGAALSGLLSTDEQSTGRYEFRVPDDQLGAITVQVEYAGAPNVALFTGAAADG